MKIAKLDNNNILEVGEHRSLFPKISFPASGPNKEWLSANSCAVVKKKTILATTLLKKIVTTEPYLQDNVVHIKRVIPLTDEDLAERTAELKANVRSQRDLKLSACDWVVTKALEAGGSVPLHG